MLRRGIIQSSEVVKWIIKCKDESSVSNFDLNNLGTNSYVWTILETSIDRSLDIVRAAINLRNKAVVSALKKNEMDIVEEDSSAQLKDMSGTKTMVVQGKAPTQAEEQRRILLANKIADGVELNPDDEDDTEIKDGKVIGRADEDDELKESASNDDSRRNRQTDSNVEDEVKQQPIVPVEIQDALESAADVCREIYMLLVSKLLVVITNKWESMNEAEASIDSVVVSSVSLLKRITRSFKLTQTVLRKNVELSGGLLSNETLVEIANDSNVHDHLNQNFPQLVLRGPASQFGL